MFPVSGVSVSAVLSLALLAQPRQDLDDGIQDKVATELAYDFGSEVRFSVGLDKAVLLRCSANAEHIQKVYVYASEEMGLIIRCSTNDGSWAGFPLGATMRPPWGGAFRQFGRAAAIAQGES